MYPDKLLAYLIDSSTFLVNWTQKSSRWMGRCLFTLATQMLVAWINKKSNQNASEIRPWDFFANRPWTRSPQSRDIFVFLFIEFRHLFDCSRDVLFFQKQPIQNLLAMSKVFYIFWYLSKLIWEKSKQQIIKKSEKTHQFFKQIT